MENLEWPTSIDGFESPTLAAMAASGELKSARLHPVTDQMLRRAARYGGLTDRVSVAYARRRMKSIMPLMATMPAVRSVVDRVIPGPRGPIPIRIVTPNGPATQRPALVWFPGGGFVIGDLSTAEPTARSLASRTGAVVVCVEYRKAPEHGLDDAYDDGLAALRWVQANAAALDIDGARVGVGGDSAGGNVAAVVAQEYGAAALERPLAVQLLVYPATSSAHEPARARNAAGGTLDSAAMHWFETHVAGATDPDSLRYAPVLTEDLSGLPPAIVVTAGWDPLRDEGITYLDQLRQAGVRAEHLHYYDDVHGFFTMDLLLPNGVDALNRAAAALVDVLGIEQDPDSPTASPAAVLRRGLDSRVHELRVRLGYLTEEAVHRQLRLQRWLIRASGLPAGRDVEALHTRITRLENELRVVRRQLGAEQQRGARGPIGAPSGATRNRAK